MVCFGFVSADTNNDTRPFAHFRLETRPFLTLFIAAFGLDFGEVLVAVTFLVAFVAALDGVDFEAALDGVFAAAGFFFFFAGISYSSESSAPPYFSSK